ncbi:MAG: flagellar export chaperone FlgN [Limnochordia bacterium]
MTIFGNLLANYRQLHHCFTQLAQVAAQKKEAIVQDDLSALEELFQAEGSWREQIEGLQKDCRQMEEELAKGLNLPALSRIYLEERYGTLEEVQELTELVDGITEIIVAIQAIEGESRQHIQQKLQGTKADLGQLRTGKRVAEAYHKTVGEAAFIDRSS